MGPDGGDNEPELCVCNCFDRHEGLKSDKLATTPRETLCQAS